MRRKIIPVLLFPVLCAVLAMGCIRIQTRASEIHPQGGITILKTDIAGNPLSGARFRIAREATWEELTDLSVPKHLLKVDDTHLTVVYESFRTGVEPYASAVTEAVTGDDGRVYLRDLPYGTCYLVETQPPEGYRRMTQPVRICVHKYSHLTQSDEVYDDSGEIIDNTVHIINVRYSLPRTGETDAPVLMSGITGLLLSAASMVAMVLRKIKTRP